MSISFRPEASRSVVVLDGVDRVAFNEDGSMELLTPTANPTGNKVMTVSQMPFSKEYVSPEQVIAAGSVISLTHSLGVLPKLVQVSLLCKVAEFGYSVGDEVDANKDANTNSFNYSVGRSSNTLLCICGSSGIAAFSTTGVFTAITNASWRLIVRAWA